MATKKKAVESKKPAKAAKAAKPALGSAVAARPGTQPTPKPKAKAKAAKNVGVIEQIDPMYVYDIRVFTGTTWLKVGEVWFDTSGVEYWGLFKSWSVWNNGPNLWIYPYALATQYGSLAAFKTHVNADDPDHNSSFLKITQTPA